MEDPVLSEQVPHLDVVNLLSAMLTDCLSRYDGKDGSNGSGNTIPSQHAEGSMETGHGEEMNHVGGGGEGVMERERDAHKEEKLLSVLCQGINLFRVIRYQSNT